MSILLPGKSKFDFPQKLHFVISCSFSFFLNKTGVNLILDLLVSMFQTCISRFENKKYIFLPIFQKQRFKAYITFKRKKSFLGPLVL